MKKIGFEQRGGVYIYIYIDGANGYYWYRMNYAYTGSGHQSIGPIRFLVVCHKRHKLGSVSYPHFLLSTILCFFLAVDHVICVRLFFCICFSHVFLPLGCSGLVVGIIASDWLERLVFEMSCNELLVDAEAYSPTH